MNRRCIIYLLATVMLAFASQNAFAQQTEKVFNPLKGSKGRLWNYNMYVYAGLSSMKQQSLWTATNDSYADKDMYSSYVNAGLCNEFGCKMLRTSLSVGYIYERMAQNRWYADNNGVFTKWLTFDWNVSYSFGMVGLATDVFLSGRSKSDDNFKYVGYNEECFNSMSWYWYCGAMFKFFVFRVEARLGTYIVPHLNIDKLSYYNAGKSYLYKEYFEVKIAYRLFTTGKVYNY